MVGLVEAHVMMCIDGDFKGHVDTAETRSGIRIRNKEPRESRAGRICTRNGLAVAGTFFKKQESHEISYRSGQHKTELDLLVVGRQQMWRVKDSKITAGEHVTTHHKITAGEHVTTQHKITAGEHVNTQHKTTAGEHVTTHHKITAGEHVTTQHKITAGEHVNTQHKTTAGEHVTTQHKITAGEHVTTQHKTTAGEHVTTQHKITAGEHVATQHKLLVFVVRIQKRRE